MQQKEPDSLSTPQRVLRAPQRRPLGWGGAALHGLQIAKQRAARIDRTPFPAAGRLCQQTAGQTRHRACPKRCHMLPVSPYPIHTLPTPATSAASTRRGGGESKHMCPCLPTAERCPLGFATCCRAGKVGEKLPYGSESHYSQCRAGLGSPSRLSFHFGAVQLHGLFLPLVQQSSGAGSSPGRADGFGLNSDRAAQRGSSTSTST